MPYEALKHADAVVIGEAEGLIEKLLLDFMHGKMKGIYSNNELSNLKGLPSPRRDLLDDKYYFTRNLVQSSRGCPHNC